jgi:hypothetical protein
VTGALAAVLAAIACGPTDPNTGPESVGTQSQELIQPPASGNVTTIAGTGAPGDADNVVAKNGTFNDPAGVAVASDGTLFVADWANNSVRRISSAGALSTVAKGSPNLIRNPRGEAPGATQAVPVPQWNVTAGTWSLGSRSNGCVDPCASPFDGSKWISGRLFGAGSTLVQTVDLTAYRTAIAASRIQGAFSASYRGGSGTRGAHIKVEYLDSNGTPRTTFDSGLLPTNGTSQAWLTVSDQRALSPLVFFARVTLITDFQADTGFDALQLRMIDVTAGANDRLMSGPSAVAISSTGELWVGANGIWRGDTGGVNLTKVGNAGGYVAPTRVSSIAALSDGYVYFADPTATKLHVRAANGVAYYANSTIPWTDQIVAVAGADTGTNHRIYVAFRNSTQVAYYDCFKATTFTTAACVPRGTIGGTRGFLDDMDGTAGGERFGYINALTAGKFGDLFVSEESNHAIRRLLLPLTQTSAGGGVAGFVDDVASTAARFSSPGGIALTSAGTVIVADRINNRVRSISCAGINACGTAVPGCTMTPTDDANACTTDTCMVLGVKRIPKPVDDGNACTSDSCNTATGAVSHTPLPITDNNECTADSCNPSTGVVSHDFDPNVCACQLDVHCDDDNPCTDDACNSGSCVHLNSTAACDDGQLCTSNDVCDGGLCIGTNNAADCNDNNPCTPTDTCSGGICVGTGNVCL